MSDIQAKVCFIIHSTIYGHKEDLPCILWKCWCFLSICTGIRYIPTFTRIHSVMKKWMCGYPETSTKYQRGPPEGQEWQPTKLIDYIKFNPQTSALHSSKVQDKHDVCWTGKRSYYLLQFKPQRTSTKFSFRKPNLLPIHNHHQLLSTISLLETKATILYLTKRLHYFQSRNQNSPN